MADVTLFYKGSKIVELSATGHKTLKTAGKYCEDDISLAYVKSGGATYQSKTVTPGANQQVVLPDAGYDALSQVTVNGDADLIPGNIKQGIDIFGVVGTYDGSMPEPTLPAAYQRIEYLDFVPSIGILVTIPSSDRMLFRARYMSRKNETKESCAFGYRQYSTAGTDFELGARSATQLLAYVRSGGFGFDDNEAYTLGSVVTSELVLKNPKTTALVGAYGHYSGSTVANMALDGRFYWAQILDLHDYRTVCWLVPCYRKSDNQLGVYDHIAQAFYYETYAQSSTTPSITAGPDVN